VGTNGIGTALATGRPAQVHAAEHFCEGIKRWTCAAAPIYDPASGAILGVLDISGPPATYQRNNLALAVATARQIEASIAARAARAARDRACLLEVCLQRLSASDAAVLIAIDRNGRLVHNTGRVAAPVALGERVPGLDTTLGVEEWANLLPEPWRAEWFRPVAFQGRPIGAVLVVPERSSARVLTRVSEPERRGFDAIIGTSPTMQAVIDRARRLAPRRVPVLIEGETGVGKELFARAMHGSGRFVAFNCGAASRELLAGELFGHVRGAFTGATSEGRAGRFELAHGGTLCLDEIGELPLDLQPILLRVLEEGVVYRLGDSQPRPVDVRLITMTNRDLRQEVEQGRFRRDLFHRIAVTTLSVPPLRERGEDVDHLMDHFNIVLSQRHHVPPLVFSPEIRRALRAQPWPGNVREVRNFVENALLSDADPVVTLKDLPWLEASAPVATTTLDDAEHQAISRALQQCGGSMTAAARMLEISRSTLYRKMGRYGLSSP
jgi:transcriptional regulator of acetoin/glycerol metabolism